MKFCIPVFISLALALSFNIQAQNVGIGTTTVLSKLHIDDGGLLITGTTGAVPVEGAGTRLMWIPSKSAFRAGEVNGTNWNDATEFLEEKLGLPAPVSQEQHP
jgi:hypothetical protein